MREMPLRQETLSEESRLTSDSFQTACKCWPGRRQGWTGGLRGGFDGATLSVLHECGHGVLSACRDSYTQMLARHRARTIMMTSTCLTVTQP